MPPGYPVVHDFLPDLEAFYREWLGREGAVRVTRGRAICASARLHDGRPTPPGVPFGISIGNRAGRSKVSRSAIGIVRAGYHIIRTILTEPLP